MSAAWLNFEETKERARFEPVLERYGIKLEGASSQRVILCPFHRERTPSCSINLERLLFHCFGCGTGGSILDFVSLLENCDLRAAANIISEICLGDDRGHTANKRRERSRETGGRPGSNSPLPFRLYLDPSHPYLAGRKLSREEIAFFGLGYCESGLMRGRICIPIHDAAGSLVAYAGRWAADDIPDGVRRYLFPRHFRKRSILFNLHRVASTTNIVLVEGYWSVFRLHQLGIPVVGLMGSSLSREHVELLRQRKIQSVTLIMDGDDAGYRARERIVTVLTEEFFVFAPRLAVGEKPDTIAEKRLRSLIPRRLCISNGRL